MWYVDPFAPDDWILTIFFKKGMEMSVVGNFQAELVPREIRGFAVGSYQAAIVSMILAARA